MKRIILGIFCGFHFLAIGMGGGASAAAGIEITSELLALHKTRMNAFHQEQKTNRARMGDPNTIRGRLFNRVAGVFASFKIKPKKLDLNEIKKFLDRAYNQENKLREAISQIEQGENGRLNIQYLQEIFTKLCQDPPSNSEGKLGHLIDVMADIQHPLTGDQDLTKKDDYGRFIVSDEHFFTVAGASLMSTYLYLYDKVFFPEFIKKKERVNEN